MSQNDDVQIELGQSVRRHIERKKNPLRDGALFAAPYDQPSEDRTPVFIMESVMRAIEQHASREKDREIGGVLLGEFYRDENGSFVEITDHIEARTAKSTDVSLTFTHETWEQISQEQSRRGGEARIVGWYHSHPGLGVFMSREDEFIHTSFFADPWNVALVVDPVYHNWGCFKWNDGALERTSGFFIFGEKKSASRIKHYAKTLTAARQPSPAHASVEADRGPARHAGIGALWAAVMALGLALAILGWKSFSSEPDHLEIAREHLAASDLSGGAHHLALAGSGKDALVESERLSKALAVIAADAEMARVDNGVIDRINWLVRCAREAHSEAPDDTVWSVSAIYESAAATYPQRMRRAELVSRAFGDDKRLGGRHRDASWHVRALAELRDEPLWRMAYARRCSEAGFEKRYRKQYDALSESDRKRADSFFKMVLDWYPTKRSVAGD